MLNSVNCSTVICSPTVEYLCSWEKPLVKTMAPGSLSHHINLPTTSYFVFRFYFALFTLHLYHKYTKNIILSYLSDLTFVSDREGIDNPFITLVARILFVCVGVRDSCVASYWIDTLVLKNWGKYLRYFAASPFPLQAKPTQAQDIARRISGAVAGEVFTQVKTYQVPITNPSPSHLHYLPFASRFPLPHFTLAVLFALSFPISSLFRLPFVCSSLWLVLLLSLILPIMKFSILNKGMDKT